MFSLNYRRPIQICFVGYADIVNSVQLVKQFTHNLRHIQNKYISNSSSTVYNLKKNVLSHNNANFNNEFFNKLLQCSCSHLINRSFVTKTGSSYINKNVESYNSELTKFNKERTYQVDPILNEIMKNKPLSIHHWDGLKNLALNSGSVINDSNIDGIIMNACVKTNSFYAGKSYFEYVNSTSKKFNLAFIGKYMRLCYISRGQCKIEDISTIEVLYNDYILKYPILDANSAENVILGISITKYWTDYRKYFDMIWTSCSPGSRTYCAVVEAAFLNKEYEVGWQLLQEMTNDSKTPLNETFDVWLNIVKKEKNSQYLEKMLKFFADHEIKPSRDIALKIKQEFDNLNKSKEKGMFTSVTSRGICKNCLRQLDPITVTDSEFQKLKTAFLDPVLVGKDIFLKTVPEEFTAYRKLLEKTAPYDVVLDGLNIAYSAGTKNKSTSVYSFMVKSVVAHFVNRSKKVLVLGRKHMNQWPKKNMKYIEEKATMFLTEDLSQDDPFLLYAALYSGPKTDFVSRDLMRGHKFLLRDPDLKNIFMKWQTKHQIFLIRAEMDGRLILRMPYLHHQSAQKNQDGSWHLPYEDDDNEIKVQNEEIKNTSFRTNFVQQEWLCLR